LIVTKIYGCSDKKLKNLMLRASHFFIKALMPRKRKLSVAVFMQKNLLVEEGAYASCYQMDYYNTGCDYTILLDADQSFETIVSSLAHEFTHIKQFVCKELTILNGNYCAKWKGVKFSDDSDYEEMPWELEAYTFEQKLTQAFFKNRTYK
jgi:hypothetical protein